MRSDPRPDEGGCLCGAVRYRVRGEPRSSALCHCRSCRRASGAPTVAWVTFARSEFEIVAGAPERFESSPGVLRQFCGRCGSPLTYELVREDSIDVTTASLDEPNRFAPSREVWLSHRLEWQPVQPGLAHFEGSS
ncbi:MAG TPA: GFA family protein [Steroidobacteraceae bacterium]|nr:GFA family protein [Steroidobacteraceae bacterium]